jgi:exodeoxyribonuclease V alpha subunit
MAGAIVELVKAISQSNVDLNQQLIILAPQKQGDCGVHNLNRLLAPIFNPKKENQLEVVSGSVIYRVGDRVIQLKNRYETVPPVMNGEMGRVIAIDASKEMLTIDFGIYIIRSIHWMFPRRHWLKIWTQVKLGEDGYK